MTLEPNLKEQTQKHSNSWRLNSILLNNEWVNNEIKEELKTFLETNENEHTSAQNLWNTEKAVLRGKSIEIQDYLKKREKFQINNLTLHLQELEEQEKTKPRESRRKEIIKMTAELNGIETKRAIERINKSRSLFFEKINKINLLLTIFVKKKREYPNK